jgi:hypothetical protein
LEYWKTKKIVFFFGKKIFKKNTEVTTKSYQGYYWTQKIAKNGPTQQKKPFFGPKGKKALGQRPYLLVNVNVQIP